MNMFVSRKILFYSTTICVVTFSEIEAYGRGFAVSPLIGNGKFYLDTRSARTLNGSKVDDVVDGDTTDASRYSEGGTKYEPIITPQMKADRCSSVTGSPLFQILYQLDPLDPTTDDLTILKQNYSYIYDRLFKTVNYGTDVDVYKNPFRKYKVFVDGSTSVREKLFSCLGVNRVSKGVVQFFLSKDYLLNDPNCEYDEEPLSGFFVFAFNRRGQITLKALAEEPAYVSDNRDSYLRYEDYYNLMSSSEIQSSSDEPTDTICGLTMDQKIRLCSLVVLGSVHGGEFVFLPRPESVDPVCRRKVMKFRNRTDASEITELDNWMIGCSATRLESNESAVFYVSPGYEKSDLCDHKADFIVQGPENEITLLNNMNCRINISRRTKYLFDRHFTLSHNIDKSKKEKNCDSRK